MKKILLLGHTGKMGTALSEVFGNPYQVIKKNSLDFDACDFAVVEKMILDVKPDILINTVAFLGIDPCEKEPEKAFRLNTLYPKILAELSAKQNFLLIHFSTDAVFKDNEKGKYYLETDIPRPLNLYGATKYAGDCMVMAYAKKYYIFRLSVIFGKTTKKTQFVEKMLEKAKNKTMSISVSDDIILSPTYNLDVAKTVKEIIESKREFGLYHIANKGMGSLYELMTEIKKHLDINLTVSKGSYKDFPHIGIKNLNTPITSSKIEPLRSWQEAVSDYCNHLKEENA